LVPPAVFQSLKAVPGLRYGRSEARESAPVKPVPEAFIEAIRQHVLPPVWAMIELQRLTGMRPGEVTAMRNGDLNTSGKVWTYEPAQHKTAHHGHRRTIFIGPKAQEVLRPWLKTDLQVFLFSPREAVEALRASQQRPHRTPKARTYAMLLKRRRRKTPPRMLRERYTVEAYGRAIARAIKAANRKRKEANAEAADIPHWHPHQLRHNAATWIRREFGLDVGRRTIHQQKITSAYCDCGMSLWSSMVRFNRWSNRQGRQESSRR
jgi:integrase